MNRATEWFIKRGFHTDGIRYHCMKHNNIYYVRWKKFKVLSKIRRQAELKMNKLIAGEISSGTVFEEFRYKDFKYIALYKEGLPVSAEAVNLDDNLEDYKPYFEAREITAKEFLDILNERVELWECKWIVNKENSSEYNKRKARERIQDGEGRSIYVDNTIYPVRNNKIKTRMGI